MTLKTAKYLVRLCNGESLRRADFSSKLDLDDMLDFGVLQQEPLTKCSFEVTLRSIEALNQYLVNYQGINDLENYIKVMEMDVPTRSNIANLGENDKLRSINPKSGLHVNSPDGVVVRIDGKEVTLSFPHNCALFVGKNSKIEIDANVLIIGVENFENIKFALRERSIFPEEKQIVFIERGPVLQQYLSNVPNQYLHFGDIDLPGISIYQTEYAPVTKERGSFFIPIDIETLLKRGSSTLHNKHLAKYGALKGINPDIESLIKLIKNKKKRLAQEYFLNSST